ncbi:unnamed protein product [Paramecium sonneborni]|uniref:Uncharacterized protein n=1 Tax=Paramecium sonneborni TaxID=65129 RepID=A0A8S1QQV4_9CILI|nr:unnamed protein product [Paramecium sonneborni]
MSEKKDLIKEAIKRRQGGGKSPQKTSETGNQSGLNFYSGDVSSLKYQQQVLYIWEQLYFYIFSANQDQEDQKVQ